MKPWSGFLMGAALAAGIALIQTGCNWRPGGEQPAAQNAQPAAAQPAPAAEQQPAAEPAAAPAPAPLAPRPSPAPAAGRTVAQSRTTPAAAPPAAQAPAPVQQQQSPAAAPALPPPPPPAPRAAPAPPPPPKPKTVTIPAGTLIAVRLGEQLTSNKNAAGDTFTATLDQPLVVDGFVIAERGARAEGRVVEADKGGRVKGTSHLSIQLVRLQTADGQSIALNTGTFVKEGPKSVGKDAAKVGAAAGIGAAIGAIAGGGRGAAIGAGVGGAAGTGGVLATHGAPAELPVETRVSFRLETPVTVTERLR